MSEKLSNYCNAMWQVLCKEKKVTELFSVFFLIERFRSKLMKPPFTLEFHASGALLTTQDQKSKIL
jgi:hypothetical protein